MGDFNWSLLHDIGYVYFVLGTMGQREKETSEVRMPIINEKFSEWSSDEKNNEKILREVTQTTFKDAEDSLDPVVERLESCMSNIAKNISKENHSAIINDLFFIVNSASPTDAEIAQINSAAQYFGVESPKSEKPQKASGETKKSDSNNDESDRAGNITAKGVLAGSQEKWSEAETLFTEAIRLNSSYGVAYRYRAIARDNLNNLEGAIKDLNQCIELDGGDAEAYRIRGRMKGRLGKDSDAKEDFSNAIKHEKDKDKLSMSYRLRGYAQYALEDYKNAISDYDKAIKLDPTNAEAYYVRGLCKRKIELEADAMRDLQKAAELGFEEAKKLINKTAQKKDNEPKDQKGLQQQQPSNEEKEDDEAPAKGKRNTYASWPEFEKEQSAKGPQKKSFMPIAKNVHDLITSAFNENKMPFEVRYGGGTFSFSVPTGIAKSGNKVCASFGLIGLGRYPHLKYIYKEAADPLPQDAKHYTKNGSEIPTMYYISFKSEAAVQEMEQTIKEAILKSYKLLSKT
jgi:tetratricopeptide (TPR) repeat protein